MLFAQGFQVAILVRLSSVALGLPEYFAEAFHDPVLGLMRVTALTAQLAMDVDDTGRPVAEQLFVNG